MALIVCVIHNLLRVGSREGFYGVPLLILLIVAILRSRGTRTTTQGPDKLGEYAVLSIQSPWEPRQATCQCQPQNHAVDRHKPAAKRRKSTVRSNNYGPI